MYGRKDEDLEVFETERYKMVQKLICRTVLNMIVVQLYNYPVGITPWKET